MVDLSAASSVHQWNATETVSKTYTLYHYCIEKIALFGEFVKILPGVYINSVFKHMSNHLYVAPFFKFNFMTKVMKVLKNTVKKFSQNTCHRLPKYP